MGLFKTDDDPQLTEARAQVVATERVCPACQQRFESSGKTLSAFNKDLGLEAHKCPHCGHEIWLRNLPPA